MCDPVSSNGLSYAFIDQLLISQSIMTDWLMSVIPSVSLFIDLKNIQKTFFVNNLIFKNIVDCKESEIYKPIFVGRCSFVDRARAQL